MRGEARQAERTLPDVSRLTSHVLRLTSHPSLIDLMHGLAERRLDGLLEGLRHRRDYRLLLHHRADYRVGGRQPADQGHLGAGHQHALEGVGGGPVDLGGDRDRADRACARPGLDGRP